MSIKTKVTQAVAKQTLKLSHNSPHILFGFGVVGVVGATVLACRATLKLEKTLEDIQDDLEGVKDDRVPSDNVKKDLAYAYGKGALDLAKLYGPSVVVGGVSVALLTSSHVQLTRRNAALTAAYTGLHQAYSEYRKRVAEHVGEDAERNLYYGVKTEPGVDENGKKAVGKTIDPNSLSVYAKIFGEMNPNWNSDPEVNRLFLQCQQNYFNHVLHARGHVFLNEVLDALGFERTHAGQIVGWAISKPGDVTEGDGYVDFRMFDPANSNFINGYEKSVLLDFNVDGPVLNYLYREGQ